MRATAPGFESDVAVYSDAGALADNHITCPHSKQITSRLPIPGLTRRDGRWYGENDQGQPVPFGKLNTQRKIAVCLRIAVMSHSQAGVIVLDGAERLETKNREALLRAAKKYAAEQGMQFIVARVTDGPLNVKDEEGRQLLAGA